MTIQSSLVHAPAVGVAPPSPPLAPRMPDWHARVQRPAFRRLIEAKRRAIGWLLGLSLGFFFVTLLLAGYARPLMAAKAVGTLNIGYVLVIAVYLVTWGSALLYTLAAHRIFDPLAAAAARDATSGEGAR